jgi:ATP-dependent Zn protease
MTNLDARIKKQDLLSAYHEAGHIVALLNRRVRVHSATIVPSETGRAHVSSRSLSDHFSPEELKLPSSWPRVEAHLTILCAGPIAEMLFSRENNGGGGGSDFPRADDLARATGLSEEAMEACLERIMDSVVQEMKDFWESVVSLANMLYAKRTADEADIFLAYRVRTHAPPT